MSDEKKASELREGDLETFPGKLAGEKTAGPTEGGGSGSDADSAAIGDGPSGGAASGSTGGGDSSATGAGPSGGA